MDRRNLDARTRRRIRWTVVVLVLVALGLYVWTYVRQMGMA